MCIRHNDASNPADAFLHQISKETTGDPRQGSWSDRHIYPIPAQITYFWPKSITYKQGLASRQIAINLTVYFNSRGAYLSVFIWHYVTSCCWPYHTTYVYISCDDSLFPPVLSRPFPRLLMAGSRGIGAHS